MTKPTLLYLTHRVPHPPNRGDRIRTFHFLRHLARPADVWLGCLAEEPVADDTWQSLRGLCQRLAVIPVPPRLRWLRAGRSFLSGGTVSEGVFQVPMLQRVLREWCHETHFDAVLCSSSALANYLKLPELSHSGRFVDLVDVDSEKWFEYSRTSRGLKRWIYHTEAKRLRGIEAALADWTDGLTVVSEAEADIFRSFRPDSAIRPIPNGVDMDYFRPELPTAGKNGCVFVGALDYKPNVEGIVWFAHQVWPHIHRQRPDQMLHIVGREPVREIRQLNQLAGVEVVGAVPDVRPFLAQAAVVVVPLTLARGIQNKVLEALAMAKAVIASPESLVGFGTRPGTHLFEASTRGEWIERTLQLLDVVDLRRDIGLAGRAYVTAHHGWEQCLQPVVEWLGFKRPVETALQSHKSVPVTESAAVHATGKVI